MAIRFRVNKAVEDWVSKNSGLLAQLGYYNGNDILDQIEKTGDLPKPILDKLASFAPIVNQQYSRESWYKPEYGQSPPLQEWLKVKSELPTIENALSKLDIPSLTDQQLQEAKDIYSKLPIVPATGGNLIEDLSPLAQQAFRSQIDTKRFNMPDVEIKQIGNELVKAASANAKTTPLIDEWIKEKSSLMAAIMGGHNNINDGEKILKDRISSVISNIRAKVAGYETTSGINYGDRIKSIEDIQSERAFKTGEEAKVSALESEIPTLLEEQRNRYFGGERQRAKDFLANEYVPTVESALGRRGLADSGEIGASVASKYGEIFGTIQQKEAEQAAEESNFWADQSYKTTFDKLIEVRTGIAATVATARSGALTSSAQNFAKRQADIQKTFNLDLFRSENERALQQYQQQAAIKSAQIRSQNEADTIASIGQTAANVAGMVLLPKMIG